jgi:tape measure domain-containing protein
MASLDEVGVRLKTTGRAETVRDLAAVRREAAGLASDVRRVGDPASARGIDDLGGSFGGLSRQLGGVHSSLLGVSSALGTMLTRGSILLGGLGVAAVGFGLKTAAGFEQSEIAMGTLLGSMQEGEALFGRLQAANLKTPFGLADLSGATQTLLNFGVAGDSVLKTVTAIGDLASTAQDPTGALQAISYAYGQINSSARVNAQDLNQLVQAGIPAYQVLAEAFGKTVSEIKSDLDSGVDFDPATFLSRLTSLDGALAARRGAAERQSKTLLGQASNLKDVLSTGLATETQPFADQLAKQMPQISDALGDLITAVMPGLTELGGTLASGLPSAIGAATPALSRLTGGMADLAQELGPHMPEILDLFGDLLGLLPEMVELGAELVPVIGSVVDVFGDFLDLPWGHEAAGALLGVLLGYRALTGVADIIRNTASAIDTLTGAQRRNALVPDAVGAPAGRKGGKGMPLLVGGTRLAGAAGLALIGLDLAEGVQAANSPKFSSDRTWIEYEQRSKGEHGALSGLNSWLKVGISNGLGDLPLIGGPIRSAIGADAEGRFMPQISAPLSAGAPGPVDQSTMEINVDARGATSPLEVEQAARRAVREALEEAREAEARRGGRP